MSQPAGENLGHKLAVGAIWMIATRFGVRSLGLISTLVLARLLVPEDFGLVAIAMLMMGILQALTEFGFDMALIQNQQATRRHYDTVWTLSLIRGVVSAVVMLAIAVPVANFFEDPRLVSVMQVLAVSPLLMQAINPATANFRKHFNFHREFILIIFPKLVSFGLTVALAVTWGSYWALIAGFLIGHALRLPASYLLDPFRPQLSLAEWRQVMNFSKWLLLTTVVGLLRVRMCALVIGRLGGLHMLGVYQVGHQISNVATTELVAPIKRALYPGYAKVSDDPVQVRDLFLRAFGLIALLALPLAIGVKLTSDHLVHVLLGENWLDTGPFIEVLALAGLLAVCRDHAKPIYLATNRPEIGAYLTIAETVLLGLLILAFYVQMGTIGVAWAAVTMEGFMMVFDLLLLRRLLGLRISQWLQQVWRPALATGGMTLAVVAFKPTLPEAYDTVTHLQALLAITALGGAVYVGVTLVSWLISGRPARSSEGILLSFVQEKGVPALKRILRRRRSQAGPNRANAEATHLGADTTGAIGEPSMPAIKDPIRNV